MKFSLFYHSLVSDWNHGNAHFLRGVVGELLARGHQVAVYEPADGWSRLQLMQEQGVQVVEDFQQVYPLLRSMLFDQSLDLDQVAQDSDVILVHEWNDAWLVNGLGEMRNRLQQGNNASQDFLLLFHDTHHRAVSDPDWLQRFRLENYDGVLAFGEVLSEVYREHGWHCNVWTWHEAADTRVFYPREKITPSADLVWIGNFGDEERRQALEEFLIRPAHALRLRSHIYGVRYPDDVLQRLRDSGIAYQGWLPNFRVPEIFGQHRVTVHVPRRFYVQRLPGIPTIRPFEAMACGIPLISAPWDDSEGLFMPGTDFLVAEDGEQMQQHLRSVLSEPAMAQELARRALQTIRRRHTCAHRVDQLLDICASLQHQEPNKELKHAC